MAHPQGIYVHVLQSAAQQAQPCLAPQQAVALPLGLHGGQHVAQQAVHAQLQLPQAVAVPQAAQGQQLMPQVLPAALAQPQLQQQQSVQYAVAPQCWPLQQQELAQTLAHQSVAPQRLTPQQPQAPQQHQAPQQPQTPQHARRGPQGSPRPRDRQHPHRQERDQGARQQRRLGKSSPATTGGHSSNSSPRAPASSEVTQTPPCAHNEWVCTDRRATFVTLRCLVQECALRWKTCLDKFEKCADFHSEARFCPRGAACPCPHVYARSRQNEAPSRREAARRRSSCPPREATDKSDNSATQTLPARTPQIEDWNPGIPIFVDAQAHSAGGPAGRSRLLPSGVYTDGWPTPSDGDASPAEQQRVQHHAGFLTGDTEALHPEALQSLPSPRQATRAIWSPPGLEFSGRATERQHSAVQQLGHGDGAAPQVRIAVTDDTLCPADMQWGPDTCAVGDLSAQNFAQAEAEAEEDLCTPRGLAATRTGMSSFGRPLLHRQGRSGSPQGRSGSPRSSYPRQTSSSPRNAARMQPHAHPALSVTPADQPSLRMSPRASMRTQRSPATPATSYRVARRWSMPGRPGRDSTDIFCDSENVMRMIDATCRGSFRTGWQESIWDLCAMEDEEPTPKDETAGGTPGAPRPLRGYRKTRRSHSTAIPQMLCMSGADSPRICDAGSLIPGEVPPTVWHLYMCTKRASTLPPPSAEERKRRRRERAAAAAAHQEEEMRPQLTGQTEAVPAGIRVSGPRSTAARTARRPSIISCPVPVLRRLSDITSISAPIPWTKSGVSADSVALRDKPRRLSTAPPGCIAPMTSESQRSNWRRTLLDYLVVRAEELQSEQARASQQPPLTRGRSAASAPGLIRWFNESMLSFPGSSRSIASAPLGSFAGLSGAPTATRLKRIAFANQEHRCAADFSVGGKVVHERRGRGVVEAVTENSVTVKFRGGECHTFPNSTLLEGCLQQEFECAPDGYTASRRPSPWSIASYARFESVGESTHTASVYPGGARRFESGTSQLFSRRFESGTSLLHAGHFASGASHLLHPPS